MKIMNRLESLPEVESPVKTKIIECTGDLAREFLECNVRNRRLRPMKVKEHSAALKGGNWLLTHQGIAFDENGRLVDGQHRLHAIAETNLTSPILVTWNLPAGSMDGVDRGTVRAIGDILRIEHGMEQGQRIAPMCAVLMAVVEKDKLKPSVADTMAIYRKYHKGIEWICHTVPGARTRLTTGPLLAAFAYAYLAIPEPTASFVDKYLTGISDSIYFAPKMLREFAIDPTKRLAALHGRRGLFMMATTAVYRYSKGEEMPIMRAGEAGYKYFHSIVEGGKPK